MAEITTTLRLNDEDQKVLASIKKRTGIVSTTQAVRLALRSAVKVLVLLDIGSKKKASPRRKK